MPERQAALPRLQIPQRAIDRVARRAGPEQVLHRRPRLGRVQVRKMRRDAQQLVAASRRRLALISDRRALAAPDRAVRLDLGDDDVDMIRGPARNHERSEEHTSEPQSLMRISYAVFCLTKQTLYHISLPPSTF